YDVLLAEDGASALDHFREAEPPLVILDLGLPPKPRGSEEGFRALGEMVSLSPEAKVIVITG
ncbi:MAG: AAA family ATPase, partial [Deltaproteobacteria bacterium]|nr:AAA family ATPase [Deltaproteobacteria bacterium]